MRSNTWVNADGLTVGFGRADTKNLEAGSIETKGNIRQVELEIHYDLDATEANVKSAVIPAGAVITSALLSVSEAFVGGTRVDLGTIRTDGTAAVAAAIGTANTAALTANAAIKAAGAQVGSTVVADTQLTYATVGAFTAGRASLMVEFVMPSAK